MRSESDTLETAASSSRPRRGWGGVVAVLAILLVNLLCLELIARVLTRGFLRDRGLTYVGEFPGDERFAQYLAERDPILGWPALGSRKPNIDSVGSRINTHFPDVAIPACASVYGDSFTYSSEVGDADAWPNQLSGLLDCRVNNFGVSGYGTDQAYLRMQGSPGDSASLQILAHASIDIVRNLIPLDAFRGGDRLGWKPRFRLDSTGELVLVPLPAFPTLAEWESVYRDPAAHFEDVWLLPGTARGLPVASPPYLLSLVRALRSWEMRSFFDPARVYYEPLYEPDHPSRALPLTEAILQRFCDESVTRGSRCLVVLIPVARDFLARAQTGRMPYHRLQARLRARGVPVLDAAEGLLPAIAAAGGDHCVFYRRTWYAKGGCTGHFNSRGYALVARRVAQHVRLR